MSTTIKYKKKEKEATTNPEHLALQLRMSTGQTRDSDRARREKPSGQRLHGGRKRVISWVSEPPRRWYLLYSTGDVTSHTGSCCALLICGSGSFTGNPMFLSLLLISLIWPQRKITSEFYSAEVNVTLSYTNYLIAIAWSVFISVIMLQLIVITFIVRFIPATFFHLSAPLINYKIHP